MPRPFQGIRSDEIKSRYDVVIIGAGIGGLVCGNLLAAQGASVLILESHSAAGGFCSGFTRSDREQSGIERGKGSRKRGLFRFCCGSTFYPLLGSENSISGKLLNRLGISTKWKRIDPIDQIHLPDGTCFPVTADYQQHIFDLRNRFPHEASNIESFFETVRKHYRNAFLHYFLDKETNRDKKFFSWTVPTAMDHFFSDKKIKTILTGDCPHWGSTGISFSMDCVLRQSQFEFGNYYPIGGSLAFSNDLARVFESNGGQILMKSRAIEIKLDRGKAVGVIAETGPIRRRRKAVIHAEKVVSNADLRLTANRLVPKNALPSEYLQVVNELEPSNACFMMHIGLKDVNEDLLKRIHGYYWQGWNTSNFSEFNFKLFFPTLYDPILAPPGCHIMIVQKVIELDYDNVGDWSEHKKSMESFIFDKLEKLIPNFQSKITVASSASAKTSERFTKNFRGAMVGYSMLPSQLGRHRPSIETPIDNLLLTGQWTRPGGGITPVIISAMRCSQMILGQNRFDEFSKEVAFSATEAVTH